MIQRLNEESGHQENAVLIAHGGDASKDNYT